MSTHGYDPRSEVGAAVIDAWYAGARSHDLAQVGAARAAARSDARAALAAAVEVARAAGAPLSPPALAAALAAAQADWTRFEAELDAEMEHRLMALVP